jgi:hypothetical protein
MRVTSLPARPRGAVTVGHLCARSKAHLYQLLIFFFVISIMFFFSSVLVFVVDLYILASDINS